MGKKKYVPPVLETVALKDPVMMGIGSGNTTPEESDAKKALNTGDEEFNYWDRVGKEKIDLWKD